MLSDEEKKAIKEIKHFNQLTRYWQEEEYEEKEIAEYITKILNLIEKQSKEIEYQKEKRENQKKELAILNAKQIEFNKIVNTVNSYKGQFKRQQKEIEELKEDNKKKSIVIIEYQDLYEKLVDKIKAKIEELDKDENASIPDFIEYAKEYATQKLQSLLEKE